MSFLILHAPKRAYTIWSNFSFYSFTDKRLIYTIHSFSNCNFNFEVHIELISTYTLYEYSSHKYHHIKIRSFNNNDNTDNNDYNTHDNDDES